MITKNKPVIFLIIPLFLSAFTHLWNVTGFPDQTSDDGTYITRAIRIANGFGPQNGIIYDHPYFGQLFLAGIFKVIGFPNFLHIQSTDLNDITHSIEMLYSTPRVVMGLLAIVDTFLIYKIAEYRYNIKVAFFASILFAVSPYSWLYRRTYLDLLQAPFLLSSILFAVYPYIANYNNLRKGSSKNNHQNENIIDMTKSSSIGNKKNILMVILSGVFLGLAIFTKIPAITMIPMIGFLVYMNYRNSGISELHFSKNSNSRKSRTLFGSLSSFAQNKKLIVMGLWFIPVILIPAIWPASAISVGQFDDWMDGVTHQATEREDSSSLLSVFFDVSTIDPVLLLLGFAGIAYATIKRDFLFLLWVIPFLIFFYLIGHVTYNYTVPIWPAFCIAGAVLIVGLTNKIISLSKNKKVVQILPFALISAIAVFGLVSTFTLISTNLTSTQIKAAALVAQKIMQQDKNSNDLTIISSGSYSWIFRYVLGVPYVFNNFYDNQPIAKKIILITDGTFTRFLRGHSDKKSEQLQAIYAGTESIAKFKIKQQYDYDKYPNLNIKRSNKGFNIDVRSNY